MTALQSIPSIVWFPLAIVWFGLGNVAILFIVTIGATWTMTVNASTGFKNVPNLYLNAARTLGSSGTHLVRTVILPASVPHIISGLRVAWAFAWRAIMAGELLGGNGGLGYLLDMGRSLQSMDLVLSIMIVIGVIGTIMDNRYFLEWNALLQENGVLELNGKDEGYEKILFGLGALLLLGAAGCGSEEAADEIHIGYFPNFTHITTVVALENGYFEEEMGEEVSIETSTFPDGSAFMEAMSTQDIDIGTVGPSPATTTYLRNPEHEIIAGAVNGGAVLATREDSGIESVEDLDGMRVAIPTIGSTQDIMLREALDDVGLKVDDEGGTVSLVPQAPADTSTLFLQGDVDAAATQEPWGVYLENPGKRRHSP